MRIVRSGSGLSAVGSMAKMAGRLASKRGHRELSYGVVDAGRRVRVIVQKTVTKQMGLKPGNYSSYVVAGTRGVPRREILAFDIFGIKGGAPIEKYKGLRSVKRGNRMNMGRAAMDRGEVRSAVWNAPRVFKRSFAAGQGFYALRPVSAGTTSRAPKIFWTFGNKPNQPRTASGRFGSSGVQYGKVRKLFGPSLMNEIPEDESLGAFMRHGPILLEQHVMKRVVKLMRF